jgi:hypothetical protein
MLGISFDLDQFAVLDVRQHAAAAVTARPGRPGSGAHDLSVFVFHLLSFYLLYSSPLAFGSANGTSNHQKVVRTVRELEHYVIRPCIVGQTRSAWW